MVLGSTRLGMSERKRTPPLYEGRRGRVVEGEEEEEVVEGVVVEEEEEVEVEVEEDRVLVVEAEAEEEDEGDVRGGVAVRVWDGGGAE